MPAQFRAPRGTRDILPAERVVWSRVEAAAREVAARYGYREIETPLFEQSAVFERGVGEVTDIVEKELFRVSPSRGEERERWALRPEATAGIVRAYLEHGLHTLPQPLRLNLYGPMFRYDRPQAGRYRQFWQWDVEAIGDSGPAIDAEIIELGLRFYRSVGLTTVEAKLNSIGDSACRPAYIKLIRSYFASHRERLPETERRRLETNPLRLLDSKDAALAELNAGAPRLVDHLCQPCADHFAAVRTHLDALGVPYRISPEIVRGLDYYTRTTFEYFMPGAEGQQDALGGGGRYDGLIELLGGRPTPAIGYALGIDRVVGAVQELGEAEAGRAEGAALTVVVGADPGDTAGRLRLATDLRAAGLTARADLSTRKLGKQLDAAARDGAHFAVILGDQSATADDARGGASGDRGSEDRGAEVRGSEVRGSAARGSAASGHVQLRDLPAGTQRSVAQSDLVRELERANQTHHHG
ncbi:MAG TPA: histidine--tRNA ligase [Candidatus Limnocylindrales bacterium]|nr:histidine--tRNA ligase [Candidatus Limnocylindrales bacterium]